MRPVLKLVNTSSRHQPWSTYAVYLTTVSHWAFIWDLLLIYLYLDVARSWQSDSRDLGLAMLAGWMISSKFLKLLGHYIRYPGDFLLLPVSIVFGYFHGFIKGYAMLSLNVVSPMLCFITLRASVQSVRTYGMRCGAQSLGGPTHLTLGTDSVGEPRGR